MIKWHSPSQTGDVFVACLCFNWSMFACLDDKNWNKNLLLACLIHPNAGTAWWIDAFQYRSEKAHILKWVEDEKHSIYISLSLSPWISIRLSKGINSWFPRYSETFFCKQIMAWWKSNLFAIINGAISPSRLRLTLREEIQVIPIMYLHKSELLHEKAVPSVLVEKLCVSGPPKRPGRAENNNNVLHSEHSASGFICKAFARSLGFIPFKLSILWRTQLLLVFLDPFKLVYFSHFVSTFLGISQIERRGT